MIGRHRRQRRPHVTRFNSVIRHWHRRTGVAAALFLIWLALSGIALNESNALALDTIRIDWPWLMNWYGLPNTPPEAGWNAAGHWLVASDNGALLDGAPLRPEVSAPIGIAATHELLFIATRESLVLLTPQARRVDELRMPPLPVAAIRRIGSFNGRVVIQDLDAWSSADGEAWTQVDANTVQWSQVLALPESERARAAPFVRPHLNLTRILLDAHSGRLFGQYGPYLIDAAALAAMLLAGSGVWMVWRANRRRRFHHESAD